MHMKSPHSCELSHACPPVHQRLFSAPSSVTQQGRPLCVSPSEATCHPSGLGFTTLPNCSSPSSCSHCTELTSRSAPSRNPSQTASCRDSPSPNAMASNDGDTAALYVPTPDPALNSKLLSLEMSIISAQQHLRNHYMNRISQLDPSRPEFHGMVQLALFLLGHSMSHLQRLYEFTVRSYYEEAGIPYLHS